jgi:hypothetical protein
MCSSGAAIAFIVQNQNAVLILMTMFIFFCTSITLCLVFLPKVLEVRQDPSGKKNQKPKTNFKKVATSKETFLKSTSSTQDFDKKAKFLSDENKRKQTVLEQLNEKLKSLIQSSIESNCLHLRECIEFIQSQDESTKLVFDELKLFNSILMMNQFDSNNISYAVSNSSSTQFINNQDSVEKKFLLRPQSHEKINSISNNNSYCNSDDNRPSDFTCTTTNTNITTNTAENPIKATSSDTSSLNHFDSKLK